MIRNIAWLTLATALTGVGCSRGLQPESGTDTDPDTGRDTDGGDPDTDAGTSDVDTDVEDPFLDCGATYATDAPGGVPDFPSCYTGVLECNTLIQATTDGGSDVIDDYTGWRCARDIDLSGPERVYNFVQQPGTSAVIRLYDRCGQFRLIEFINGDSSTDEIQNGYLCGSYPTTKFCDVGTGRQEYQELSYPRIPDGNAPRHLEIIVDSQPGNGGNYVLEVVCDN